MQAQRFSLHLLLITRMRPSSPLLASQLLHDDFRKKVTNVTFPLLSLFCRKAEKLSTQRCKASFTASFCRKSFRPRCWTNSALAWIKAPHISQRPTPPCGTSSRRLQIATDIHKCRYILLNRASLEWVLWVPWKRWNCEIGSCGTYQFSKILVLLGNLWKP